MSLPASLRNKANAKRGNRAERQVCRLLERMGYLHVEPIERAWAVQWRGGKVAGAKPKAKVSGDITAICPGGSGRAVHCEVKSTTGPSLSLSAFKPHQLLAMDAKHADGVLVLVAWVYRSIALLCWPIADLATRRPLGWNEALRCDVSRVSALALFVEGRG